MVSKNPDLIPTKKRGWNQPRSRPNERFPVSWHRAPKPGERNRDTDCEPGTGHQSRILPRHGMDLSLVFLRLHGHARGRTIYRWSRQCDSILGAPQLCSRSFSGVADLVNALSTSLKGYGSKINFSAIVDLVLCVLLHCAHSVFAGLHTARFLSSTLEAWTSLLCLRLHNWNLLLNPASRYDTADEIPFWS